VVRTGYKDHYSVIIIIIIIIIIGEPG